MAKTKAVQPPAKTETIEPPAPPIFTVLHGPGEDSDGAETILAEAATLEAPPADGVAGVVNVEDEKQHRIWWSGDEIEIVAREIAREVNKAGWRHVPEVGDRVGRNLLGDMLASAQLKLPRERRRLRAGVAVMKPELWAAVEIALTNKSYLTPAELEQEAKKVAAPAAQVAAEAKDSTGPTIDVLPNEEFLSLSDTPTALLLDVLFGRFLGAIAAADEAKAKANAIEAQQKRDHDAVMARLAQLENKGTQQAQERVRLPKVAILGCQAYEFHQIRKGAEEAGIKLDFRHYDQEAKPTPVNADWAISLRFVNHPQLDQITAAGIPPARSRVFTAGGVSKAIDQIKEWFPRS